MLRTLKGRTKEIERMMNLSHVYLENIKHLTAIKFGATDTGGGEMAPVITSYSSKQSHPILSRQSPYPGTR